MKYICQLLNNLACAVEFDHWTHIFGILNPYRKNNNDLDDVLSVIYISKSEYNARKLVHSILIYFDMNFKNNTFSYDFRFKYHYPSGIYNISRIHGLSMPVVKWYADNEKEFYDLFDKLITDKTHINIKILKQIIKFMFKSIICYPNFPEFSYMHAEDNE